ncbi:MAG: STAS domain-containing protein [Anaerolineae bacterium]|nr:STAS domain-containing protein [Anaerolineae bacterium]
MISQFEADVDFQGRCAVVHLSGEIDSNAEDSLVDALGKAIESNPDRFLLDFRQVQYINSKGIALIVGLLARYPEIRGRIAAYGLTEHYQEIFKITRLMDYIFVLRDWEAALDFINH